MRLPLTLGAPVLREVGGLHVEPHLRDNIIASLDRVMLRMDI